MILTAYRIGRLRSQAAPATLDLAHGQRAATFDAILHVETSLSDRSFYLEPVSRAGGAIL